MSSYIKSFILNLQIISLFDALLQSFVCNNISLSFPIVTEIFLKENGVKNFKNNSSSFLGETKVLCILISWYSGLFKLK